MRYALRRYLAGQGRIPLFLPLELKVFRLASQFIKCSLGVVAIARPEDLILIFDLADIADKEVVA